MTSFWVSRTRLGKGVASFSDFNTLSVVGDCKVLCPHLGNMDLHPLFNWGGDNRLSVLCLQGPIRLLFPLLRHISVVIYYYIFLRGSKCGDPIIRVSSFFVITWRPRSRSRTSLWDSIFVSLRRITTVTPSLLLFWETIWSGYGSCTITVYLNFSHMWLPLVSSLLFIWVDWETGLTECENGNVVSFPFTYG